MGVFNGFQWFQYIGVPKNGCFTMENPIWKWMTGTAIAGKLHIFADVHSSGKIVERPRQD